jgi:hypothetical protein
MNTKVVNYRTEDYDVWIGRPSIWGNPFIIGRDGTREDVVAQHRLWLVMQPDLLARLPELRGKKLGCCCKPLACHGDTLAEFADTEYPVELETHWIVPSR